MRGFRRWCGGRAGALRYQRGTNTPPLTGQRLLHGERPSSSGPIPPYGVAYQGKTKHRLTIRNDAADGLAALLEAAFAQIDAALAPGGRLYVAHPAGELSVVFASAFVAAGWRLRQTLVWVRDAMVLGRSDYHYQHEPILYGYKPAARRLRRGGSGEAATAGTGTTNKSPYSRCRDRAPPNSTPRPSRRS